MSPRPARLPNSPRAPREHGFWVLLGVSVLAGLMVAPSRLALLAALGMITLAIVGAALVGKRIRKNPLLQAVASTAIAFITVPIVLAGGQPWSDALFLAVPLALAYLSGTFCVRSVLERARKHPLQAKLAGAGSILLPAAAAAALYFLAGPLIASALIITALYCATVVSTAPSAKRLKVIGLTISFAHGATALLLVL